MFDEGWWITRPVPSCRLRRPGSRESFLWLKSMRTPCSLTILKKSFQGDLDLVLSGLSSSTSRRLRQRAQLCPLVDRAAEDRQRAAEKAAPQCDWCTSGNTSPLADLFPTSIYLFDLILFLYAFQMFLDQEGNQHSGLKMIFCFVFLFCLHSTIMFADIFLLLELKVFFQVLHLIYIYYTYFYVTPVFNGDLCSSFFFLHF